MNHSLIELNHVTKTYAASAGFGSRRRRVRAVHEVSLALESGRHLGLVGESGSGKSTLARLLLRLEKADQGTIVFDGTDLSRLSQRKIRPLRRKMQMVFQDPDSSLDPRFSIRRILDEALACLPKRLKFQQRTEKMVQALEAVGLPADCLTRFPHEFSGGERQRIAIARALVMEPSLLILDEAVSSLDVLVQTQIIDLLKAIERRFGVTYVFITHNLRVARRLCERIAVMYQGRIVEMADTAQIFSDPRHPYTQRLFQAAMDYHLPDQDEAILLPGEARLHDQGGGHFVLGT